MAGMSEQDGNADHSGVSTSGDGWAHGPNGSRVWGLFGAAGLFLVAGRGQDATVLLQHRAAWTAMGNTWGIPGGAREPGEDAVAAALRETHEECGIVETDVEVLGHEVTAGPYEIDQWTYTTVVARCPHPLPTVANEESEELRWVPLADVAGLDLLPPFRESLPRVVEMVRVLNR